jgi:NAD dependent epimerase/dehydratase family enzyme
MTEPNRRQPRQESRRIAIAGGSGQVGQILARHFHGRGDRIVILARGESRSRPWPTVVWDGINLGVWANELEDADVLLNLAGRNVNC